MKLAMPHWILIALTIVAAALEGVSHVPELAAYAPMLNTLAGLATGAATLLGVTSHSAMGPRVTDVTGTLETMTLESTRENDREFAAVAPAPSKSAGTIIPPPKSRGFIRAKLLPTLAFLILTPLACGLWGGVVAPTVTLGACIADVASKGPYSSFESYFAAAWNACKDAAGADAVAILDAIITSADPNVKQYATEAANAKADPKAREALVQYVKGVR